MSLYQRVMDEVRREHVTHVNDWNEWSCSCGTRGRTSWNTTRPVAKAGAARHLLAQERKIRARLQAEGDIK